MNYQNDVFDFFFKNKIPYWMGLRPAKGTIKFFLWILKCHISFCNKKCHKWSKSTVRGYKRPSLFRLHLILDEVVEIIDALITGNLEELADSTTDLLYVTFGMQVTYFIPSKETWNEVHRSNLTKDFKSDERRKYKGENWTPPNMSIAIAEGRLRQSKEYKDAYNRRFRLHREDDLSE